MQPCQKNGGATWTSEKFENVQRLIERSRQLSGGCVFRECERMSDGKTVGANAFATESRIRQSLHKHMEEGKADLNLTLKILQQRVNSLEQDSSRFNVAFVHLQGGLSKQAMASNILVQDIISTREVVDKLSACSGAVNTIELNKRQTKIENDISSLNHKVHKHEKKGIEEERAEEEGQFCNGLGTQTEGAEDNEPELPTRFHHDLENTARDSWREMEGRLSQMSSDIERTVSDHVSSSIGNYQSGLTEEGMKDIITNTVRKELGTMVRNELNAIEGRIMTQTMENMNSLVYDTVSNGELSVAVVKDVSVEKHEQNGFYPTSSAEEELAVLHNKEDLKNMISSQQALSSLRSQQLEADTLSLNRKHATTNYSDNTGCFTEEAPELNQKLTELTKRVDALTNELRARRRSSEYCEYHHQRERKTAAGEDDTTTEMAKKKNCILCKEHKQHNATDIQDITSTQNTLSQRLEQMELMFISISQKYSLPVVEKLAIEVPELSKRLTGLTKRIDAITVINDDELRDDVPLSRRGGDASDIEVHQTEEQQHNRSLEDIISAQDTLLLRLEQVESTIILNGKKDSSSAVDLEEVVSQLTARLMDVTKQVSTLRSKLKEEEVERNPKNEEKENPHFLSHSEEYAGIVLGRRAVEQEIIFERKSHHVEEAAAEPLIPPNSKEEDEAVSIPPDNKIEEAIGHVTNPPSHVMDEENEKGGVCQADVKEVINNGEQLKLSSHHHQNDVVRDVETATPQPMQVLGFSTKYNKEQKRAVDGGMVINHKQESQAAATINDVDEVEKSSEKMRSELSEFSALDRLRAWRADIATLRKEGKQHTLDSDDDLEEYPCLSLNG